MSNLFRREAVEHQQQRLLGTIIVRQSRFTKVATAILALLSALLVLVACCFGFARRETLEGRWLPESGLVHATTPQSGLVESVRVSEGQSVQKGDVLLVLSSERENVRGPTSKIVGAELAAQREMLTDQLRTARGQAALNEQALRQKLQRLRVQLAEQKQAVALQARRTEISEDIYRRFASREYAVVVSGTQIEEKQANAMEQALRLSTMRREQDALRAEVDQLQAELDALPLRTRRDLAGISATLSGVRQTEAENDTRHRWEIRAARAGLVTALQVEAGQAVAPEMPLLSIAPEGTPMEAVLYAPTRAAGLLKVGMPATLRFDALPFQKYGQFAGTVRSVSGSPVAALEMPVRTASAPMYRIRVSFDRKQLSPSLAAALRPGMQLQGTITLEHRRFVEWAVEPLISAKGQL
jgi:membrane fusion protein